MIHYRKPQPGYGMDELWCSERVWRVERKTTELSEVTCHACLENVVRFGDEAAARIVELDQQAAQAANKRIASEAEGSSSGSDEAAQPGSSPGGRSYTGLLGDTAVVHNIHSECLGCRHCENGH